MKNEHASKSKIQKAKIIPEPILKRINSDFEKLKEKYPFSKQINSASQGKIVFEIYAVDFKRIVKESIKYDCLKQDPYSKRCIAIVDENYLSCGAKVFGLDNWNGLEKINYKKTHFYKNIKKDNMYELCVCPSKAIKKMKNPLLGNIKTADHIMNAYELYIEGITNEICLKDYSHGSEGEKEYEQEQKRRKQF